MHTLLNVLQEKGGKWYENICVKVQTRVNLKSEGHHG
jgi:hypothetical protein